MAMWILVSVHLLHYRDHRGRLSNLPAQHDHRFYVVDYGEIEEPMDDEWTVHPSEHTRSAIALPLTCHSTGQRQYSYSQIDETIYFNYYSSGIWIPWYEASQVQIKSSSCGRTALGGFPDD